MINGVGGKIFERIRKRANELLRKVQIVPDMYLSPSTLYIYYFGINTFYVVYIHTHTHTHTHIYGRSSDGKI